MTRSILTGLQTAARFWTAPVLWRFSNYVTWHRRSVRGEIIRPLAAAIFFGYTANIGVVAAELPKVIPPPDSFFEIVAERDRDVARKFYKKFIDVNGMPVVAAEVVADLALQRTYEIVN